MKTTISPFSIKLRGSIARIQLLLLLILILQFIVITASTAQLPREVELAKTKLTLLPLGNIEPSIVNNKVDLDTLDYMFAMLQHVEHQLDQCFIELTLTTTRSPIIYKMMQHEYDEAKKAGKRPIPLATEDTVVGPATKVIRWGFLGAKSRYECLTGDIEDNFITTYDGSATYLYQPAEQNGRILPGRQGIFDDPPLLESGLLLMTIGKKRPSEYMKMKDTTYNGKQMVGDTECLKFTVLLENTTTIELWISPLNDYQVKRVSFRQKTAKDGDNCALFEVTTFVKYGDIWFPQVGLLVDYQLTTENHITLRTIQQYRVISFLPQVPDGFFALEFPHNTIISDLRKDPPTWHKVDSND